MIKVFVTHPPVNLSADSHVSNYADNIQYFFRHKTDFTQVSNPEEADILHLWRFGNPIRRQTEQYCRDFRNKKIIIEAAGIATHVAWDWQNQDAILRGDKKKEFNKEECENNENFLLRMCNIFRTPSVIAKNSFMSGSVELDSKILVRPPGYRSDIFNMNSPKNQLVVDIIHNKFVIGFFGRFRYRRGFHNFIDIINGLKNIPKEDYAIIACGQDCGSLSYAQEKFPDSILNICNPKTLNDMASIMRCCDVSLFPSIESGFNLSSIESMGCGCYPIVSSNTGSSYIILENSCGNIINPYTLDMWIKNIYSIYNTWLKNNRSIDSLKGRVSKRVIQYDFKSFATELEYDYRKVVS